MEIGAYMLAQSVVCVEQYVPAFLEDEFLMTKMTFTENIQ